VTNGNVPPPRPLRPFWLIAGLPATWYDTVVWSDGVYYKHDLALESRLQPVVRPSTG
jgi:hypothetical protein